MSSTGGLTPTLGGTNPTTNPVASGALGVVNPTAVSATLADFLNLVNGTDAYDSRTIAVGKLSPDQYLQLPNTLRMSSVIPKNTGRNCDNATLSNEDFANVYIMNKAVFGTDERAIKIALLRTYAVSLGWYTSSYEVNYAVPPSDSAVLMEADLGIIKRHTESARILASLLPFAAEFVFRTMGHHYLTGLSSEYETKYQKFFNACIQPNLTGFLAPSDLYHVALHWVSLSDALTVAANSDSHEWLPNAIVIRATAAPAGTAIIATSLAILDAMDGTGLKSALVKHSGTNIGVLEEVGFEIKKKPSDYHTIPSAYGSTGITDSAKADFENAKKAAIRLAPVLQGFLDALPNSSSLAQAKALAKHADTNPLLRKKAKVFFKEIGTVKAGSIEELFSGDKRTKEAIRVDDIEDVED